jgi:hypothetical protein
MRERERQRETHTHTHTHTHSSCCTLNELHKSILAIYPAISIKLQVKSCLILTGRVLQHFRFINVVTVSGTKKWRINLLDLFDTLNSRLSDSKHHTHTQIGQSGVLTERTSSGISLCYLSSWSSQAVRSQLTPMLKLTAIHLTVLITYLVLTQQPGEQLQSSASTRTWR